MGAVTPTTVSSFHALMEVLRVAVWEAGAKADAEATRVEMIAADFMMGSEGVEESHG